MICLYVIALSNKRVRSGRRGFFFRVKMGEYEVELDGTHGEVLKTVQELPGLMRKIHEAFEEVKPKRTTTLTVKTAPAPAKKAPPAQKYPMIHRAKSCSEAVLKILETNWGKWRPRTLTELKETLKVNKLRYPGRTLAGTMAGLVNKGKIRRWRTDAGYVYILAEEENLA